MSKKDEGSQLEGLNETDSGCGFCESRIVTTIAMGWRSLLTRQVIGEVWELLWLNQSSELMGYSDIWVSNTWICMTEGEV